MGLTRRLAIGPAQLAGVDLVCGDRGASIDALTEPRARTAAMILMLANRRNPRGKSV